jgi:RNA polymerase sigma-70 factor (ECF subfamily)
VDDDTLIAGTLAGRREDFEALVERYQRMIYSFVAHQLRDPDAAADVVQATFVQAYANLARFRRAASFKTWLHQIAFNQCRARRRSQRVRGEVPIDEVPERTLASAAPAPDDPGERVRLGRLIDRLPARQRAVLALRVFGDLPFKDIGRVEGISENAAKVNYHHAIVRLRQWLSGDRS